MGSFGIKGRRERTSFRWDWTALPVAIAMVAGCGGGSAPPQPASVNETSRPAATKSAAVEPEKSAAPKKEKESGIPMDAFFDNPLEIVANSAVIATPATPAATATTGAATAPAEKSKPAPGGGAGWSELLSVEIVQSEVKKVQNRLKASLQGQGTYNGNYKDIAVDGTVIAAMAGIAGEHSGDISWKANAPLIRDFGHELSQSATGLGKENYEKSKAAFDKLESVFGGSIPADAPKVVPTRPFHETATRNGLMKRIEKARNHLRDNINTDAKLKSESEAVLHETLIITALGKMVATEGYESADEEEYQKYAEALIEGAKEATAAVKDQSFQKFTESMNKVNKSCDQCHANYGTG